MSSAANSWYGADWQRARARHLREPKNRVCCECGIVVLVNASKDHPDKAVVDHEVPIAIAPERRLDPTNLRTMHKRCHDRFKQSREKGGTKHLGGADASGMPSAAAHHWNR